MIFSVSIASAEWRVWHWWDPHAQSWRVPDAPKVAEPRVLHSGTVGAHVIIIQGIAGLSPSLSTFTVSSRSRAMLLGHKALW